MTDKKSFVLYHDIREPLEQLSMEQRGELFTAILDYSESGTIPAFTGALRMAFAFIKNALDRDAAAWEAKREKRAAAGRLGGLAKVANASNAKQTKQVQANQAVNVPVPVNVPVIYKANASHESERPKDEPTDLPPWIGNRIPGGGKNG